MPKWLRRMFKGMLLAAVEVAFSVGRAKAHMEIDELPPTMTNHEKQAAHTAVDAGLDRALKEIREEL